MTKKSTWCRFLKVLAKGHPEEADSHEATRKDVKAGHSTPAIAFAEFDDLGWSPKPAFGLSSFSSICVNLCNLWMICILEGQEGGAGDK